jgi:GT2 family glycosyltransferase
MAFLELIIRMVRNPLTVLRGINRDTVRLAWVYLRSGDFKKLTEGIGYFLGRTSPGTEFRPVIIHGAIAPDTPITLPLHANPLVSIIIPVHNQWDFTHSCLAAIAMYSGAVPYEVIVADDLSSDRTVEIAACVTNVRVVRNEENLGFLRNCNNAARHAKGKYLLFLNNDTNVQPGWLDPLVTLMEGDPTVGIAGSKLVYPDGMLQEAGGITWNDASGWNFGWRDDPEKPEYNYVKETDYVSGAALMVRRELWEKAEGFDEQYAPAYYEDNDLAFRARALGYRVVFQPQSVVVHFEGISHGRDMSKGIKSYQERNRERFIARWRETLERDHYTNGQQVFRARDRSRDKKSLLVIDHYVPMHDRDAGSFFMYSLLRGLVGLGYRVTFWPENLYRHEPYTSDLQQLGVEVIYGHRKFEDYMQANDGNFDAAILTRNHIAIDFIDTVRQHVPRVLYHDPDLEFLREGRRIALEGGPPQELDKIKERELYLFRNCDVIGIHSPLEKEIIERELPAARVEVLPLPVRETTPTTTPFAERAGLLFVGGTHPPNADGLAWFIREIFPLLRRALPGVPLTVAGEVLKDRLQGLDLTGVHFTGYVPDLYPMYGQARLFVAPLRYGAGIKGKVLEAMAHGIAVVTTTIGAEGIGLTDGEDVLIADHPEGLARAVAELYNNEELWVRIATGGRRHVQEHFSQARLVEKLRDVLGSLVGLNGMRDEG